MDIYEREKEEGKEEIEKANERGVKFFSVEISSKI